MSIHVALNHVTHYRYDRRGHPESAVGAAAAGTALPHTHPVLFDERRAGRGTFINWQQDPQANYLARLVFPDKTDASCASKST